MQLEAKKYLFDIKVACERVTRYCLNKRFEDYTADDMLRSAVERQLAIAGEAMANLARIAPTVADQITAHRRIIGFRNILVHGYASVVTSSCGELSKLTYQHYWPKCLACWANKTSQPSA